MGQEFRGLGEGWAVRETAPSRTGADFDVRWRCSADWLWVDVGGGGGLFVVHVRKVAPGLVLVLASPVVFFGLLKGALYLTGRFEPVSVVRQVKH